MEAREWMLMGRLAEEGRKESWDEGLNGEGNKGGWWGLAVGTGFLGLAELMLTLSFTTTTLRLDC